MDNEQDMFFNDDMDMDGQDDHGVVESSPENPAFANFHLKQEIMKALDGFIQYPTEVQSGCLIDAMQGKNILCQAKTGSGKATLSVLAILHQLNYTQPGIYVIVVCPTRQLVTKIIESYKTIAKHMPFVKVDTFGQKAGSLDATAGVHIGLGTPGRVIRAIRNRKVDFSHVKHLVLYEADKMLSTIDMRHDIEDMFRQLPPNKQLFILSERFSKEVRPMCKKFLQQPLKVFVDDEAKYINMNLDQFYININEGEKQLKLLEILKILHLSLIIVYVNSPALCETITTLLQQEKLSATSYHLGMKVADRNNSIMHFKKLKKQILVVAKMLELEVNINIANVIILYDKPADVDVFLKHVAPASRTPDTKGLTITFLPEEDDLKMVQELEDWYGATFTQLPNKIQLEVTSYDCAT